MSRIEYIQTGCEKSKSLQGNHETESSAGKRIQWWETLDKAFQQIESSLDNFELEESIHRRHRFNFRCHVNLSHLIIINIIKIKLIDFVNFHNIRESMIKSIDVFIINNIES